MKRYIRLLQLVLLAALLLGALPTYTPPAAARTSEPPAVACYHGALPPPGAICMVVPVVRRDGSLPKNAVVTVAYNGREVSAPVTQLFNQPAGTMAAALNVGQLGAGLGDLLTVEVQHSGPHTRLLAALAPDRATLTQTLPPVELGADPEPGHKPIWGYVYQLDDVQTPLLGAMVELFDSQGNRIVTTTTTIRTGALTPTFELDPSPLQPPTTFQLTAAYQEKRHTVTVAWTGNSLLVPIPLVVGWGCVDLPPLYGGGGGLPESFCLTGSALEDGQPVDGAEVSIEVGGRTVVTRTAVLPTGTKPQFAAEIGALVNGKPLDTQLRITVVKDGYTGSVTRTLGELGVGQKWGADVSVSLIPERTAGLGVQGGTALPVARIGEHTYVGSPFGGGVVAHSDGTTNWERRIGNTPTALPGPEVSALLALKQQDSQDWLLAGTRDGRLAFSQTSGRTWRTIDLPVALRTTTALTQAPDSTLYVADQRTILHLQALGDPAPDRLSLVDPASQHAAPFQVNALAAAQGRLFAGSTDGLHVSADAGANWTLLRATDAPIRALAIGRLGHGEVLLVGTDDGLFRCELDGSGWMPAGLDGAVFGLAADTSGLVSATTPRGVFSGSVGSASWTQIAASDTLLGAASTIGTPDVFDLTIGPNNTLIAASGTGVYSSIDDGFNWQQLPTGPFGGAVRSVAPLADGTLLALSAQGLYRWIGRNWTQMSGLPSDALNGAVVRTSRDGRQILVGRGAGPGDSLYASQDGGASWQSFRLGDNHGVSAIAFYQTPQSGIAALIATEGDGVFGWMPGTPGAIVALPRLQDAGISGQVGALAVIEHPSGCRVVVGTLSAPARIASRPCDQTSSWGDVQDLPGNAVGAVQGFAVTPADEDITLPNMKLFAATSEGVFEGTLASGWSPAFGSPLRPLTLLAPPAYGSRRLLIAGGAQAGVLLLNDTAPDVFVSIAAPAQVRGAEMATYTVTLRNQGMLPAASGQITLTLSATNNPGLLDSTAVYTYPQLQMGEVFSFTMPISVPSGVRPGLLTAAATAAPAPGERFVANNTTSEKTLLRYQIAPDPAVSIGGQTMTQVGETGTLRIRVVNMGEANTLAGATLTFTAPPTLTIGTVMPLPYQRAGNTITWQLATLPVGAEQLFSVDYRLPAGTPPDASLPISAVLTPNGVDRELNNNRSSAALLRAPDTPRVIVLTNWTRLADLGPIDAARTAVDNYIQREFGLEVALDGDGPCPSPPTNSLACRYKAFDDALDTFALKATGTMTDNILKELAPALQRRQDLVDAIEGHLATAISGYQAPPTSLYIIGGDRVIPSAFVKEELSSNSLPESHNAPSLPVSDSLYSVLVSNSYVTDRPYEQIGKAALASGRQPGTPDEIAKVLDAYAQNDGELTITRGDVAGVAPSLTENTQQATCEALVTAGLTVVQPAGTDCTRIPDGPKDSLPALTNPTNQGSAIVSLSGHANSWQIGDLASTMLEESALRQVNILLLLGCHSGLVPAPDTTYAPALPRALAAQAQPSFGYTGYAYAASYDGKSADDVVYAEKLHMRLLDRLLSGSLTLGEVRAKALEDYGIVLDPLAQKTLDTLTLYGPPTYKVRLFGTTAAQAAAAAPAQPAKRDKLFTLTPSYRSNTYPSGTIYSAQLPDALQTHQVMYGRSVQPAALVPLPADVGGVVLRGGRYHDVAGIDPVIANVVPLGEQWSYAEPAYEGPPRDWPRLYSLSRDGSGTPWLRAIFGQWSPRGQVERLYDSLTFQVIHSSKPAKARTPHPHDVATCRQRDTQARLSVRADADIAQAEALVFDQGQISVLPMSLKQGRWTATAAAQPGAEFLIQTVDTDGNAAIEGNGDAFYAMPGVGSVCGS